MSSYHLIYPSHWLYINKVDGHLCVIVYSELVPNNKMNNISLVVALTLCVLAVAMANTKPLYDINKSQELFEKFQKDYNRVYKDEADKKEHYDAFVKSLKSINEMNAQDGGATYDINKFADYTKKEQELMHGLRVAKKDWT